MCKENEIPVNELLQLQKYHSCNCRDVSGNIGACPVHSGVRATDFDMWWQSHGKVFDPDTEDVSWFDKRKDLAEFAYSQGHEQLRGAFQVSEVANILTNVCQIIDMVKQEWGDEWSDWDQSVRDEISQWLKHYHGL